MKRQIGMKRSFNYEDLASIVESASLSIDTCDDRSHHVRRHKRIRTEISTSSSFSSDEEVPTKLDKTVHHSNVRLISPTTSRDRVTITPDSSPSMQSMTNSTASSFSLSSQDCPATAALNQSLNSRRSSLSDWDSAFFPVEEGKEQSEDRWPTVADLSSTTSSLKDSPTRRIMVTSRRCSLRQDKLEADPEVGKLQTAFSLLSLPRRKESGKFSRLSSNRF